MSINGKFSGATLTSTLVVLGFLGCSSDKNSSPSTPVITDDASAGGSPNGGGSSTGGAAGHGGKNNGGASATDGGLAGASNGGTSTDGGDAGGGTTGSGGSDAGPPCNPANTGTTPPGCFPCTPTVTVEFLNHCTSSQYVGFDTTRLPSPLPAATW